MLFKHFHWSQMCMNLRRPCIEVIFVLYKMQHTKTKLFKWIDLDNNNLAYKKDKSELVL